MTETDIQRGRVRIVSIGHKLSGYSKYVVLETNMRYGGEMVTSYHYDIPEQHVEGAINRGGLHEGEANEQLDAMRHEEKMRREAEL